VGYRVDVHPIGFLSWAFFLWRILGLALGGIRFLVAAVLRRQRLRNLVFFAVNGWQAKTGQAVVANIGLPFRLTTA
jgi:hypothetical protein